MSDLIARPLPPNPLDFAPERAHEAGGQPYAVVDIGSNSVRLVVYDGLSRAPLPRFNEKSLCRLGAGLERTGELSPEGFQRTLAAVRRFRAVAEAMQARHIDVVATEAVRRASNGGALVAAIEAETGLRVRVLSGDEEAHYAALGVIAGFYHPAGLVGDMGGGSLEVAEVFHDQVGERVASVPLGALPVATLLDDARQDPKRYIDALLKETLPPSLARPLFYAVGGGWRSFASAHMAATSAPVRVTHGYSIETSDARAFAKTLWRFPGVKATAVPGVSERRLPTLAASALVLDRVLKRLAPERLVFSALGLREGWLYAQLSAEEQRADPLLEGARTLGGTLARVPGFAAALVRWTDHLFPGETDRERRLRVAACAISDIAWRDHSELRASESFRSVIQFPFIGIEHSERVFVAAAIHARYAGNSDDPTLQPPAGVLSASLRRRALILGRVLLLGYRLSGCVPDILGAARLRITTDLVELEVAKGAGVPDSEVVADRLRLVASAVGIRRTNIVEAGA